MAGNLPFHAHNGAKPGGPDIVLTRPDHKSIFTTLEKMVIASLGASLIC